MNFELAKKVADSVLYEGYLLYPYRASAVKNRQRFNFGVLLPPAYAQAQTGNDAWSMRTECLVAGEKPQLDIRVRFLQVIVREAGRLLELEAPGAENMGGRGSRRATARAQVDEKVAQQELRPPDYGPSSVYEVVPELTIDGQAFQTWQEAVEREVAILDCDVAELAEARRKKWSESQAAESIEFLRDATGRPAGVLVRRVSELKCSITPEATALRKGLWKIAVEVENETPCDGHVSRDEALPHSLVAAHTILTVRDGQFVSQLDPPQEFAADCATCRNVGTWPVLLGSEGERDWMLSSPIILYDYPQIAPESGGSFFDGLEIDEMLALRVMTMTDDEKREMRNLDSRAREILERTESMPEEHLRKLHGTIRGLRPTSGN
jgi:hypothetical protein